MTTREETPEERRRRIRRELGLPEGDGSPIDEPRQFTPEQMENRRALGLEPAPGIAPSEPPAALPPAAQPPGVGPTPGGTPGRDIQDRISGFLEGMTPGPEPRRVARDLITPADPNTRLGRTGTIGQGIESGLDLLDLVSMPFESVAENLFRSGTGIPQDVRSVLGQGEARQPLSPTQAIETFRERPWYEQLGIGLIDPTLGTGRLPQAARGAQQAARNIPINPSTIREIPASLPQPVREAAPSQFTPEQATLRQELGLPPEMAPEGFTPEQVTLRQELGLPPEMAPEQTGGAIQSGMGIGEAPTQGQLFPESPTGATAEPLVDPQQLTEQASIREQLGLGQQQLPEPAPLAPVEDIPQTPLEAARRELDEAVANLEAEQSAGRGAPKFGTPERAAFDAERRAASSEGRPQVPKRQRVQQARARVREARDTLRAEENNLATRSMAIQDHADAARAARGDAGLGEPPPMGPISPSGRVMEGGLREILDGFKAVLNDPARADEWQQALVSRSQERARRFSSVRAMADVLIEQGVDAETAIQQATREMAGELPSPQTPLHQFATPVVRDALFQEVYAQLADDAAELMSTATALRNALAGKPIPRAPGTAGGSAFSRLVRVFGEDLTEKMSHGRTLEEIIALETERGLGLTGFRGRTTPMMEFPEEPLLRQPDRPLIPEAPGPTSGPRPPDPRSQAQREIDLQIFREATGDASPPTGPNLQGALGVGEMPPEDVIRTASMWAKPRMDQIREWANIAQINGVDAMNLLRSNVASADISYLRQQAFLIPGHPLAFAKSFKDSLRSIWSPEYAKRIDDWIRTDPDFKYYALAQKQGGRDFLRPMDGKLVQAWERAEDFIVLGEAGKSPFPRPFAWAAGKIPWINISARAFVTGVNSMNWHIYKGYLKTLHRQNEQIASGMVKLKPGEAFDMQKEAGSLASMLADMSGRGPIGPLKSLSPALNAGFFSVRLNIGRLISPRHMFSQDKWTRQEAWKNFATAIGTYSSLIFAGREMGLWDVETDRRSSDFMKIRIGNTRVDIWGGYQQFAVLYGRLLDAGSLKSTSTGAIMDRGVTETTTQFMRTKLSPAISQALMMWEGRDFKGADIDRKDLRVWLQQNIALSVQDVMELWDEHGLLGLALGVPAGASGLGIQVHGVTQNTVSQEFYGLDYDQLPLSPTSIRKDVRDEVERRIERDAVEGGNLPRALEPVFGQKSQFQLDQEREQATDERAREREIRRERAWQEAQRNRR